MRSPEEQERFLAGDRFERRPVRPSAPRNPLLRLGLTLIAVGVAALTGLLVFNHGLEDTLPFVLYITVWLAVPVGSLCCLIALCLNLVRARKSG
jgi:hypothetical protein